MTTTCRLDRRILTPAKETLSRAAAEYPFATASLWQYDPLISSLTESILRVVVAFTLQIFGSIFLVLSLGPLLAFVCFVVFAGSILLATSLVFFVFWAGVIIGSAGGRAIPKRTANNSIADRFTLLRARVVQPSYSQQSCPSRLASQSRSHPLPWSQRHSGTSTLI